MLGVVFARFWRLFLFSYGGNGGVLIREWWGIDSHTVNTRGCLSSWRFLSIWFCWPKHQPLTKEILIESLSNLRNRISSSHIVLKKRMCWFEVCCASCSTFAPVLVLLSDYTSHCCTVFISLMWFCLYFLRNSIKCNGARSSNCSVCRIHIVCLFFFFVIFVETLFIEFLHFRWF